MQRKRKYYWKVLVATALGAAAGLAMGLQIEATHAITRSDTRPYLVAGAYSHPACECGTVTETQCIQPWTKTS